ncbi:hypothetical protein K1719_042599 [Acacia pycnantha]|nr:hypothetical protein K1719_042599 [Acacia pycnantha]
MWMVLPVISADQTRETSGKNVNNSFITTACGGSTNCLIGDDLDDKDEFQMNSDGARMLSNVKKAVTGSSENKERPAVSDGVKNAAMKVSGVREGSWKTHNVVIWWRSPREGSDADRPQCQICSTIGQIGRKCNYMYDTSDSPRSDANAYYVGTGHSNNHDSYGPKPPTFKVVATKSTTFVVPSETSSGFALVSSNAAPALAQERQRLSSRGCFSSEDRPHDVGRFYKKTMVEDPWQLLKPVIWKMTDASSKNLYTPEGSKSWASNSSSTNKGGLSPAAVKSSSQPSRAEYLVAALNEAANDTGNV